MSDRASHLQETLQVETMRNSLKEKALNYSLPFQNFARTTTFLILAFLGANLIALDQLNFQVQANANDLFGHQMEKVNAESQLPFWKEGGERQPFSPPKGAPGTFSHLASKASPAVVNIQTAKKLVRNGQRNRPRHPLEEFFGMPFPNAPEGNRSVPSLGTGFVISEDGYIITNNHVVEDVDKIEVNFLDGEKLPATVVGSDPKTDIALIMVEVDKGLKPLPLGDSEKVDPGDWVVAIGNPFGLGHTVTAGIVSAKSRVINPAPDARRFDDFIQTDAAINPGNSGGPLINLFGEVIGINTAINPRANTIGFAVPVNIAKDILPQLRFTGRVSRGWLGVYIQAIDETTAELMELETGKGALISKVEPGGPASEAGMERGDVIIEFNGEEISEMESLPRVVARTPVGTNVNVIVLRKGKHKTLTVKLGELDGEEQVASKTDSTGEHEDLGLTVGLLDERTAEQLGLENSKGVLVRQVKPESPASIAKLRRGDVILEVNQKPVPNVKAFNEATKSSSKGTLLLVRRGEAEIFVALKKKN